MGLAGNLAKKAGKAAAKKAGDVAKNAALKATPGLCPETGGRHQYKNQNAGNKKSKHVVLGCKCGVLYK